MNHTTKTAHPEPVEGRMTRKILSLLLLCGYAQSYAMQRMIRVTKRCMSTVTHKKINKLAKRVAKRSNFPKNCSLGKNNTSVRFKYDILKALHREQEYNRNMPQLEESVETIFLYLSQMNKEMDDIHYRQLDYGAGKHEKIKSFSDRLTEEKKE